MKAFCMFMLILAMIGNRGFHIRSIDIPASHEPGCGIGSPAYHECERLHKDGTLKPIDPFRWDDQYD